MGRTVSKGALTQGQKSVSEGPASQPYFAYKILAPGPITRGVLSRE